jgi:hypothetical protein
MSLKFRIFFLLTFAFFIASNAFAQNKFEGYNIMVDAPDNQKAQACAIRYVPPTTDITITDLDRSTPMKVSNCGGAGSSLTQAGATAMMHANPTTFKWCFQGEDKRYRISFKGDQYAGAVVYDWIATPDAKSLGNYNIRDFGAVGDGTTDDTIAIKSALAFAATHNGGIVQFPQGDYAVGNTPNYRPIALPSGITLQGISSLQSAASTNNVLQKSASRITLNGANRALFRIGECTERVTIRDIELFANSSENTSGIEAVGAFSGAQGFVFERVTFSKFHRGINAHGLEIPNVYWQFDYIKIEHCRFIYITDTAIYSDISNSDWKIEGSLFINPLRTPTQKADSMYFRRAGGILIENTFGGGYHGAFGGTFLNILDSGPTSLISSQTEQMTNSIVYNEIDSPYAGDYSYPITVVNSVFGAPIVFKARRTFVSTGNLYLADTFKADARLRIYSTGDRFCYDMGTLGCQGKTANYFDGATVVFMTGTPTEFGQKALPTIFGTDVQFNAPVQMPSVQQNALPTGKANGSMVYCANCRRNLTPCEAGGTGAPAMVVGNQWSCL